MRVVGLTVPAINHTIKCVIINKIFYTKKLELQKKRIKGWILRDVCHDD